MDSQLLNVFHEDPFEGNFVKYEAEPNFWSPNDDLQLTDTLNGILPIAPTDESLLNHNREEDLQNRKNLLMYSEFVGQQLGDQDDSQLSAQVYQAMNASDVELYDQQRQLSAIVEYDDIESGNLSEEEDVRSQCSVSTFRTRTDSSSIGDYESHSSDYDEEENEDENENEDGQVAPLESFNDRKNRTLSTNTITSEVDAFGLNIDVNNFDLADFITKDDFAVNLNACRMKQSTAPKKSAAAKNALPTPAPGQHSKSLTAMSMDSEGDDDSIIDVETIDVVDVDESLWADQEATPADDLCYKDNVKADPSWCPSKASKKPTPIAKEHKSPEVESTVASVAPPPVAPVTKPKTANICLVPSKKQCDFLKRKVGVSSATSKSSKAATKKVQEALKSTSSKPALGKPVKATGLGLGGKNLALLKQQREVAASVKDEVKESSSPAAPSTVLTPLPLPAVVPKRKLNLEEYKQRRCGGVSIPKSKPTPPKQLKLDAGSKVLPPVVIEKPTLPPSPQKTAIAKIVNSLKCPSKGPDVVPMDPITVAKNKVLRMLEMKRAQQLKIIDSRVSAKVPRVTKLPPLKDIVKGTYCMEVEPADPPTAVPSNKLHPDYEEIIIVSVSSNTDITIPPNQISKVSPRSLLKSSVLLYKISNGHDAATNMNNSLLASIQSELVKQTGSTIPPTFPSKSDPVKNPVDKNAQHGEDMIIMHLPKDRVRKTLVTMATQTDFQPEFPVLGLPKSERKSRERVKRKYRKRRHDSASASNGSSSSSGSSPDCSSLDSYRSRSRSNSIEQLRNLEASAVGEGSSIGNCGYSSRSTHRHRSSVSSSSYSEAGERRQRRTSYNKRRAKNQKPKSFSSSGSENSDHDGGRSHSPHHSLQRPQPKSDPRYPNDGCQNTNINNNRRGFMDRNVSQPAVEERRIVYVGRIEQETTKEMLRRKFLPYGSIKQITLHYKENGMKYGFVTYEKAQDAFTAIDTSPRDSQINMYDISFGGRRAFCRASYADLDNAGINNYDSYVFPKETPAPKARDDSFEALLLSVKAKLNSGKAATPAPAEAQPVAPSAPQDDHRM
ncbi:hypothetical protein KR067_007919 [Drosophila pandora]|nr:hypothetical protein KR067_007919 [Drosophila pandora]